MPTRTSDKPDAAVWVERGVGFYLCAHCAGAAGVDARRGGDAVYRAAIAHLWRVHAIRRVWLEERQPNLSPASQLAFDLAVQHNRHF